jgi:Domain of unknown function (DUF397)
VLELERRIDSVTWRTSSFSGSNGGNCLESASIPGAVLVRDTKNHGTGPVLRFTPAAWTAFLDQAKNS